MYGVHWASDTQDFLFHSVVSLSMSYVQGLEDQDHPGQNSTEEYHNHQTIRRNAMEFLHILRLDRRLVALCDAQFIVQLRNYEVLSFHTICMLFNGVMV